MNTKELNDKFGITNNLFFREGREGKKTVVIKNIHSTATILLQGAQVLSYQPQGKADFLWVSREASYDAANFLHGGIPICWPYFAEGDGSGPIHGFVRSKVWQVIETKILGRGETYIKLSISDDDSMKSIWPYKFELVLEVTVGETLSLTLTTTNKDKQKFEITQALHTYFRISNPNCIVIDGLAGCLYSDKVLNFAESVQHGNLVINEEVDRVYTKKTGAVCILDKGYPRKVTITPNGSKTVVVWNPWEKLAKTLPYFGDDEYNEMTCVETANALKDAIEILPGKSFKLSVVISE
jgi:glucose-6-phosphate 1-epimerase